MRIGLLKIAGWRNYLCSFLVLVFLLHASPIVVSMNSVVALPTNIQPDLLQFVAA